MMDRDDKEVLIVNWKVSNVSKHGEFKQSSTSYYSPDVSQNTVRTSEEEYDDDDDNDDDDDDEHHHQQK